MKFAMVLVLLLALLLATDVDADTFEPPPEAPEGDYSLELADSLGDGLVETTFRADGRSGDRPRRAERVRFRGGGLAGSVRDGDDPLAGGRLETAAAGGRIRLGRLSPRWARGLLLGSPAEPWSASREAGDRGERATYRGRAGEGATYTAGEGAVETLAGRFAGRTVFGGRMRAGPLGVGTLASGLSRQASVGLAGDDIDVELAGDARGRWRGELAGTREVQGGSLTLRVRAGVAGFRSLAEPRRSGPSRALAAAWSRQGTSGSVALAGALWNWRAGACGARGAVEVERGLGQHASLVGGFEEQRGVRREPVRAPAEGFRQGVWTEWRARSGGMRFVARHELWGGRALVARVETGGPFASTLGITHAAWSTRRGESLYLPEQAADRLTLRALTGTGRRTQVEWRTPVSGGQLKLGLVLVEGRSRAVAPAWSVEWTRRGRT